MTDRSATDPKQRQGGHRGRSRTERIADDGRSDALLTAAVRDGAAPEAVEELYRRHADAVLAYARTCCRDPHTAEDLTSETFTRTVQAVRDGKGPTDAWRPYLLAVVRHTASRWAHRAGQTDLAPEFDEWLEITEQYRNRAGDEGRSSEDHVMRAVEGGLIAAAFRSLPERWRAALWHSVVERESADEVGALLGLTRSGVASLTARAREGLKEAYLAAHAEQGAVHEECRRCSGRLATAIRRSRPRRDAVLDRHLEQCPRCRGAVRDLTDLNQRLRTVLPAAVLMFGAPAYLRARATAVTATGPAAGGPVAGAKAGALAVGAAAVLLGGWALWPGGEEPGGPVPTPAVSDARSSPTASLVPPAPETSRSPRESTAPPLATASPSAASPGPASRGPAALGGPSTLRFVSTGGCMEIPGGVARVGIRPVEAACDHGAVQQWRLLEPFPGDRGRIQVRNEATGMCLTRSGGPEDHAPVDQQSCAAGQATQLWNLWADPAKGEAALRNADGTRYLGLVDWARADKEQEHGSGIGTTRYYYGSASMRFLVEPGLLEQ
ncbi:MULTISPECIES: sigma-70 family RNA polymerase sigma factor [unclassified Streptomyces]|uniref:sigma-70 family RNA polymerase sigma factor n=1 Tax=unclassified Streptomyces TaxID=2593676 RepID=UPI002ED5B452|nr:sigma-70 family RNA polymerase sigma factor [Streptomyces sp. NBC_00891]WSY03567.1 sigma-70 family RNA polymerase sigma factor [Streptomyces sp. NBC_00890]WSZ05194.1 sigma-70 family RNA polymerase sigma factor [Streptomyces sp. NBC_00869]WSZ27311.1 sigma-70 family RNA polymerase sigma factor [Streptomyces sp. NBC_00870]